MDEWSLLDWVTRMLGILFFIRGIRYTRGTTVEYHNSYGGKSTASADSNPKLRNVVRVAGVAGIILGLLMIIYGGGVLDILFPFF
ncbi:MULTISPECIES: hypothetical protein [unclassified Paenibacillus]|uniref:hypothetical protein n=1 Tax=unclassified Paenibacillus TaxID=185978 RepID=UPI0024064165|nr:MULTISPECIES: hypothetical protein [unclassified Paenibacillus]MDF9843587.1 hypothetical protein [Paenibacillus sp. PastF-2]MDF9850176.1 hypothetical protein [Paenibacillus sp. PastM-2]MDF9857083.1 hypothetical protein [Paenibacillus sp. PastF-1]MDH6482354.1 hypothetical protein [Paenibacillus sp. PastH-2]MDH6509308.1 hypothetical protein [Paenibacillus sp. PastM-3]